MRLGLIARASNTGLGVQTHELYRHLKPHRTMVINCAMQKPVAVDLGRFPDAQVVNGFVPSEQDCRTFLRDIDVVVSCETFYRPGFADLARSMGVKTVLAPNFEFLDPHDRPDLWAAPSMWHYDDIPEPKCFLPVPIETSHVGGTCKESARNTEYAGVRAKAYEVDTPTSAASGGKTKPCTHFLHCVGRPATRDRNGSEDLLKALQFVTTPIRLTVTCQEPGHVEGLVRRYHIPPNVELVVRSGDVQCNTDLYRGQDVLLMPRRFGGLCLPVNEALGQGMPVVMPAISPNDSWLPPDWLVPATHAGQFMVKQNVVDFYSVSHRDLAQTIDRLASDAGFFQKAKREATELRDQLSWERLLPTYQKVLNGDEGVLVGREAKLR